MGVLYFASLHREPRQFLVALENFDSVVALVEGLERFG